jgi:hypothetical protein
METKVNKLDRYKKFFIDKNSIFILLFFFLIIFSIVIFQINFLSLGQSEAARNTSFFAIHKVFISLGLSFLIIGSFIRSFLSIDIYLKSDSSYLFKNFWYSIFIKIILILVGALFIFLYVIFYPTSEFPFSLSEYFENFIGVIIFIVFLYMVITDIKTLFQNKGDYILIDEIKLTWFDDKNNLTKEIKIMDIKSCEKILGGSEKAPKILGVLLNSGLDNESKIDFKSMSFIPQSKFIYNIISGKVKEYNHK